MRLLTGTDLHDEVIESRVLAARSHVWIATADLKDMHVRRGRRYVPILEPLDALAAKGVTFRIVHSNLPSRPFRETFEAYPRLSAGALELQVCPRSHWKIVIVDGTFAYCGSANFTGAGLGVKSAGRRNLEIGVVSDDPGWVASLCALYDEFWIGAHCDGCRLRARCPDPIR